MLLKKISSNFKKDGFIVLPNFINSKNFDVICKNLDQDIKKSLKIYNIPKLGGSMMGNLNLYPGVYGKKIFNLIKKKNFLRIIEAITKNKIENFTISVGGNLSLPKKHNQNFHTDGNFNQKLLIASLATSDIDLNNGPTEITHDYHDKKTPYWKFLLSKKKKKMILLKKGDLFIRKHSLWHRGTKNHSDKFRFLLSFLIFEKNINSKSNINKSKKIIISSNFFGNTFLERVKEFIYVYLNFIYVLFKIYISIKIFK